MNYYSLGKWIVEVQQQGKHRAEYGKKIIINLSKKLTEEFGKGFSECTLAKARKFYLTYNDRISETLFTEFAIKKSETSYDHLEGKYDSGIFTAEKHTTIDKAFKAEKHIQPYVFTDGNADKSVERKFAEELDGAAEVCVYAKLPKGFSIPTPVGHYSPDWVIAFNEGTVKHIFFVAETKGTMESMQLRPIEKAKIMCARKFFNEISTNNVVYHEVDSYQSLLNIMNDSSLDKKVCK